MIGTSTRDTPGATLGRLSTALLALACTGALVTACAPAHHPAPRAPAAPPRIAPSAAGPAAAGPSAAGPAGAAPGVPRQVLAVADPRQTAVPAPRRVPTGRPTPATPRHSGPHRAPVPRPSPRRSATVCDLGEQYGGWALGSSQDASCRAVYG